MIKDYCTILFSPPDIAHEYQAALLSANDALRTQNNAALHERPDWQSSRALKQRLPKHLIYHSLSHKKGHAAMMATALQDALIGIDIEYCQQRDFIALSQWCCTPVEQTWLVAQANMSMAFYQLWTLKEALIKAHHGQLTDMPKWSLINNVAQTNIQIPAHTGLMGFSALIDDAWLISFVGPDSIALNQYDIQALGTWANLSIHWQQC